MTGVQEQRGFEEAMGDQMEDGQTERAKAAFHDHVPHLGHGRKSQRLFDVVLREHHTSAQQHRDSSDHKHDMQRGGGHPVQRGQAVQQKAARIHDAGVHERRDRRGRVHGIGKPHMQRKLSRLGHRADKNEQGDHRDGADRRLSSRPQGKHHGRFGRPGKEQGKLQGAVQTIGQHDPGQKGDIPETMHDEGFEGRVHGGRMRIVVDQQQVEEPTHQLPKHEEREEVRARDHAEKHEGDQA